jgi:SynChlorMet cassette radical SAM/SPASM protein ScmF
VSQPCSAPPLAELYVYLAGTCNLRCRHCWIDPAQQVAPRHFLPWSDLRDILVQARDLGLRAVKLTGGEPLLHPEFLDVLRGVHRMGLQVRVESNGTLVDERHAEALGEAGAVISLSLDGPTALLHDRLRGVPGAFVAACNGAKRLRERGLPFQVITCLHRGTQAVLPEMVSLAERIGADSLKVNIVNSIGRSNQMRRQGELLSVAEVLAVHRDLMSARPASRIAVVFDVPPAFKSLAELRAHAQCSCGILNVLGILSDGRASLCGIGTHVPALDFGRPLPAGLRLIWEDNPVLRGIRERLPDGLAGVCARCVFRRHCMGKCLAHNYWSTGDLFAGFAFCQEAHAAGLFPERRLVQRSQQGMRVGEAQP